MIFLKKIYIYIYIKFSGIPVKSQTVWQSPWKYITVFLLYLYCLLMQKKNGFVEFHRFMKKERQLKQNLFKSVRTYGFL